MKEDIKKILEKEIEAIGNIPLDNNYQGAVDLIAGCNKLVTSGMGKAGQIALNISTTFSSTGTPSVYLHPSEAQHGDLGILQEGDVLLLLSNSGKTREILELMQLSKNLYPNIHIISITGKKESELCKESDICLHIGDAEEICPLGLTPTISTTLMTVMGDLLVVETMKAIGFTKKEYSKRHHSGYLGQKSKEESKIFCIGYNKTGSTSLYHSILNLGVRGDLSTMGEGEFLMYDVAEGNVNNVIDWIEKRNDVDLFKDVPFSLPHVWKLLYEKYPNAIYILSERDSSEQWYNSIYKFHTKFYNFSTDPTWDEVSKSYYRYRRNDLKGGYLYDYMSYTFGKEEAPYDKNKLIASYESHNNEVKEFFKDKNNFISVNVSKDNDYLKLCSFLGKDPIDNKFLRLKVTKKIDTW